MEGILAHQNCYLLPVLRTGRELVSIRAETKTGDLAVAVKAHQECQRGVIKVCAICVGARAILFRTAEQFEFLQRAFIQKKIPHAPLPFFG